MRDEILSSADAQHMDTSRYEVSNLEDIEFDLEDPDLNTDAVFGPGIATPFSPSTINGSEMGSLSENPTLIYEGQDKEKSPPGTPPPTTPFSERPIQPPVLMRSHPFGTRTENVPIVYKQICLISLYYRYCVCFSVKTTLKVPYFIVTIFKK